MASKANVVFFCLTAFVSWLVVLSLYLQECRADERLVIAGSGDSQSLLRELAAHFMREQPELLVEIPDSVGSGGGIRGVLDNHYEMARTARPLTAKEQDGTLIEYPFAISPVVFALHPTVKGIENLTSEQLADIYRGTTTSWDQLGGPAARIYPVDREQGDSSRTILEKTVKGFAKVKSVAKIFYTTPETAAAIRNHNFTVGFLPKGIALESNLKVVAIDGSAPTIPAIQEGRYPYTSTFFLVVRRPVSCSAQQFIDYIYSPGAASIMLQRGLIPLDSIR